MPCTCYIDNESDNRIVFCPMHAAAEKMLAVLQRFVIVDHDGGYEFESNEPNLYRQIMEAIDAAEKGSAQ